ncbi:hypothetical protein K9M78_01445 [Candidatus Bipolaricaulota bacterium]|nr:hypothetical protein [Candidatus Bipolaricaulota bacterium]
MVYTRPQMELMRFYAMLFLPTNGGYVEIRPIDVNGKPDLDKRKWIPTINQEEWADKVLELKHSYNVYFGTCTRKKKGKGTTQYLKELPALWADLDGKDYDGGISEARQRIEDFQFPPSYVNFSGHGLHCWWLLNKPYNLDQGHSRPTGLLKALQVYELESDPAYDLPRLLRPPNTVNLKDPSKPLKVKSLKMEHIRYSIKELAEELDWKKALEEDHEITEGNGIEEGKYDGIEKVLDSDFIRYCKENAEDLKEPLWWALITVLLPFKGGRKKIHELSKPYPEYSKKETDNKIAHAKEAPGPHTAKFIREHGFDSKDCKEAGVKSPAGLAFVDGNEGEENDSE